jgi:hypothetical protein
MSKNIYVDMYNCPVAVITSSQEKKIIGLEECEMGLAGYDEDNNCFFMVLPKKWDEFTVFHECHHMARFLNDYHGVKTNTHEHEADAYLMEALARKVKTEIYKRKL